MLRMAQTKFICPPSGGGFGGPSPPPSYGIDCKSRVIMHCMSLRLGGFKKEGVQKLWNSKAPHVWQLSDYVIPYRATLGLLGWALSAWRCSVVQDMVAQYADTVFIRRHPDKCIVRPAPSPAPPPPATPLRAAAPKY